MACSHTHTQCICVCMLCVVFAIVVVLSTRHTLATPIIPNENCTKSQLKVKINFSKLRKQLEKHTGERHGHTKCLARARLNHKHNAWLEHLFVLRISFHFRVMPLPGCHTDVCAYFSIFRRVLQFWQAMSGNKLAETLNVERAVYSRQMNEWKSVAGERIQNGVTALSWTWL